MILFWRGFACEVFECVGLEFFLMEFAGSWVDLVHVFGFVFVVVVSVVGGFGGYVVELGYGHVWI